MKYLSSTVVFSMAATLSSAAFYSSNYDWYNYFSDPLLPTTGPINFHFGWETPLEYMTTYHAGEGPYYVSNVFTNIDNTMHYEEYGLNFAFIGKAWFMAVLGSENSNTEAYLLRIGYEADLIKNLSPYRQAIWFTNFLSNIAAGNDAEQHLWLGGVYSFNIGQVFVFYEESLQTFYENIFSGVYVT